MLVRAVERLSRCFGAPPPLNEDLEPVFPDIRVQDPASGAAGQLKPAGRVVSMQLDRQFYSASTEMRSIGVALPSDVRTMTLWEAARMPGQLPTALREHLDQCPYCSELLRSLQLMHSAILSRETADFIFCPGSSALLQDPDYADDSFREHLQDCELCRNERTRAIFGEDSAATAQPGITAWSGRTIAGLAAAVVILAGLSVYFVARSKQPADQMVEASPLKVNNKYSSLAEPVELNDKRAMQAISVRNESLFLEARYDLQQGNVSEAILVAQRLANEFHEPGGQMLYAACLYSWSPDRGYREMQKAEAMPPRNAYRCWATLQCALKIGDKSTAEREIGHLSADPEFGARAKVILDRMRAIN
jgi:hypothetical protein